MLNSKKKTIFRVKLAGDFTMLPNSLLRDSRLSFRSRGILVMILSHKEDWEVTKAWLQNQGLEGRESIHAALKELQENGYAKYEIENDKIDGRFKSGVWSFFAIPSPEYGKPSTDKPSSGKPAIGKPATKKNYPQEGQSSKRKSPECVPSILEGTELDPAVGCDICMQVFLGDEHQEDGTAEPIDPKSNPLADLQSKSAPPQKPGVPPTAKSGPPKTPAQLAMATAETLFIAAFKVRFDAEPDINYGRDRKELKGFLERHPEITPEQWITAVRGGWDCGKEFTVSRCKTITGAVAVWNDIATRRPRNTTPTNFGDTEFDELGNRRY